MNASTGFKLSLNVPLAALTEVEAAFQALGGAVVHDPAEDRDPLTLEVYLAERPSQGGLAAALEVAGLEVPEDALEELPALDWVAESQKGLPPLCAGRFFVYGGHAADQVPAAAVAIRIDAGQAFGTGHHESTRGCLLALDALGRRNRPGRCLDLGCGSGILAIAMAKLWRVPVLACDIDPQAVAVTRANARLNGVGLGVRAVLGDGAGRRDLRGAAPYDVIAANILAGPLAAMAGELRRILAPGGALILSGFLASQERDVLAPYRARGLRLARRLVLGDWVTLVLSR